jgi:aspartyl aminopeptidase
VTGRTRDADAAPADPRAAARRVLDLIGESPSPYHCAAAVAHRLEAAGWKAVDETDAWDDLTGGRYLIRGGALMAWWVPPAAEPTTGYAVIGAHTDSPNLRVKPRPDTGAAGYRQLAVEVYGGPLLNSWLDRDLGLSGRVVLSSGDTVLVRIDRPLLRVTQLAIHLDRSVNDEGVRLDKQQHLTPIWGIGTPRDGEFRELLASEAGVAPREVRAWDVMVHDLTAPGFLGKDEDLLASARLDNQCSVACGLDAVLGAAADAAGRGEALRRIPVLALFDHEEVGSDSTTGAGGPLLETVLDRIVLARGGGREERHRALADSRCVSADMAHAVHPNYAERHEPGHRPVPNAGPVLKVNVNQRYATEAPTAAMFVEACETAGVPWQTFVSRNTMPCGSTIGPITATRLGIPTVDVGCAQLSMHSARELAGAFDPGYMVRALEAFLLSA